MDDYPSGSSLPRQTVRAGVRLFRLRSTPDVGRTIILQVPRRATHTASPARGTVKEMNPQHHRTSRHSGAQRPARRNSAAPRRRPRTQPLRTSRGRSNRPPRSAQPAGAAVNAAASPASASRTRTKAGAKERTGQVTGLHRYLVVVGLPHLVMLVALVLACTIVGLIADADSAAVIQGVASLWLIFNAAPIAPAGVAVGVIPLALPMLFAFAISRRIRAAIKHHVSLADLVALSLAAIAMPLVITVVALLVLHWGPGTTGAPSWWSALAATVVVHAGALCMAIPRRLWRALARRFGAPGWVLEAGRASWQFLAILAGGGLLLWLFGLVGHTDEVAEIFGTARSGWEAVLIVLVVLVYLPNTAIAGAAVLTGSEVHAGAATVSIYAAHKTALPPLPIFSAWPAEVTQWAPLLLIFPAGVGAWLALRFQPNWRQALVSTGVTGLVAAIGCYLASGELGVIGQTGPTTWLTSALTAVWLGAVSLVAAGLVGYREWAAARSDGAERSPAAAPASGDGQATAADAEDVEVGRVDGADAPGPEVEDDEAETRAAPAQSDAAESEDAEDKLEAVDRGPDDAEVEPVEVVVDDAAAADDAPGSDTEASPDPDDIVQQSRPTPRGDDSSGAEQGSGSDGAAETTADTAVDTDEAVAGDPPTEAR